MTYKRMYYLVSVHKRKVYYKMCETCRPIKSHINFDCINYDKFNKLITDLNQSIQTNKQV